MSVAEGIRQALNFAISSYFIHKLTCSCHHISSNPFDHNYIQANVDTRKLPPQVPRLQGRQRAAGRKGRQPRLHHAVDPTKTPEQMANCINLNCASQKYYIDCFEVLKNRKECIKNLRFEVEQNGQYRLSHLKTD